MNWRPRTVLTTLGKRSGSRVWTRSWRASWPRDSAAVVTTGSEKAAAYRLGLAQGTVKQHLARVRARVGAANPTQAVWRLRHELEGVNVR